MKCDLYENEITMPRWELSDPFGRGAIRKARWEYTQMKRERDALKNEIEAIYDERGKAVNMLVEALHHEQKLTDELNRRLAVCDEARKSLGEKLNAALEEKEDLARRLNHEHDLYAELLRSYAQLEDDHEDLLRKLTDKEESV